MHILTLTPFYPTAVDDGYGCFIAESVSELESQGIESSVIAVQSMHRPRPQPARHAPAATWESYFSFPGNAGLASAGRFLHSALRSQVRRIHAQRPVSLIHAHAALPCGRAAMLLAKDLGVPFVVTVHGLDVFSLRQVSGWFGRRCSQLSQDVYNAAARVICISEHVAGRIREGMRSAGNICVVYNGVDASLFAPPDGPEAVDSVILSVGNLIPIKGHDLLLRAVAAITPHYPKVRCRVIGDGPERVRLQELSRELQIEDRVELLGRRPRSEVAAEVRQCTLFALPSWYEGLGCVYLEAMAAERPAIGCREQGIAEIIRHGENGWLIEPKDLHALTAALHQLLSDRQLRKQIGCNGRQTVLQNHTLTHQATQLLSIYGESLQSRESLR